MIGLDLNGSKLLIPKFGISLEMFERENGESEGSDRRGSKEVKVLAAAEVMVPPWTELFVRCRTQKAVKDRSYLCEPRVLPGRPPGDGEHGICVCGDTGGRVLYKVC